MDNSDIQPRESIMWFARLMEAKLQENDHKQHWSECDMQYLHERLHQEVGELDEEVKIAMVTKLNSPNMPWEAADVANFCMMIAEKAAKRTSKTRK